jgi:hypothetical protein
VTVPGVEEFLSVVRDFSFIELGELQRKIGVLAQDQLHIFRIAQVGDHWQIRTIVRELSVNALASTGLPK